MVRWVRKLVLKYALNYIRKKLCSYEERSKDLAEFHSSLYSLSISEFMSYCITRLGKEYNIKTDVLSFPMYLKELITPLDDNIENIIVEVIDRLDPKNC